MKRAVAKIVPKLLTFEQKQGRMDIAQDEHLVLLKKVVTADESWVNAHGIETKGQSSRFVTIEEIKEKSKQLLFAIPNNAFQKSISRVGKNADISVLYLRGVTLKGTRYIIDK